MKGPFTLMTTKSFYSLQALADINSDIYCQLLEIDSYRILLNLGSDVSLEIPYIEILEEILPSIDCVLISHSELKFFGGILQIFKKHRLKIIMTLPIHTFSRMIFEEILRNKEIKQNHMPERFTEDDLDDLYDNITIVKYSQPIEIGSLRFIAKNSGHSLGGSLWQIQKDIDTILYAVDINHKKENHIDGCNLSHMKKNFLFLANCDFVGECPISRKNKEKAIHDILMDQSHNKMLLVCDLMRSLELCCVVNDFLQNTQSEKRCVFISFNSRNILEKLRGFLEWTGDIALQKFTSEKKNPFKFEKIFFTDLYHDITQNDKYFIIINDGSNSVFLDRLVFDNNDENNLLVFFNEKNEFDFLDKKEIEVPFFTLLKRTDELQTGSLNVSFTGSAPLIMEQNAVHNEGGNFISRETHRLVFPFRNKCKPKDLYGEFFDRSIVRSEEEPSQKDIAVENEIIEEEKKENIRVVKQAFNPKIKHMSFSFNGLTDGNTMKDILESVDIEKMILFGKDKVFVDFFRDTCLFTKCIKEIVVLDKQKVNLSSDTLISKVYLEENFIDEIKLKQFKNMQISPIVGEITNNLLRYERPLIKNFCFGDINVQKLRSSLLDKNLSVREVGNNTFIIDHSVVLTKDGDNYLLTADFSTKYIFIRNIIYQSLIFIE